MLLIGRRSEEVDRLSRCGIRAPPSVPCGSSPGSGGRPGVGQLGGHQRAGLFPLPP